MRPCPVVLREREPTRGGGSRARLAGEVRVHCRGHGQPGEAKPSREAAVASRSRALHSSMMLWVMLAEVSLQKPAA